MQNLVYQPYTRILDDQPSSQLDTEKRYGNGSNKTLSP